MGAERSFSQGAPSSWPALAGGQADPESLEALATAEASELSGPDLVDAIVAAEKALSLLAGVQMRLMDALAAPFAAGDPMRLAARLARKSCITGDDSAADVQLFVEDAATCLAAAEIAAALRISPVTAGIRVREAAAMTTVLAPTLQELEAGRLDRGKGRIIAEHCQPLSPEHAAAVQQIVLHDADRLSTSELRDLTGQAVITIDPAGSEDRHRAAAARRELTLRAQPDAMATLSAFLPADGAVKIFQISDLLATGTAGSPDDPRGIGARRIDALVDIADQLLTHGHLDLTHYLDHALPDSAMPGGAMPSSTLNPEANASAGNRTGTPQESESHHCPDGEATADEGTHDQDTHEQDTDEQDTDDQDTNNQGTDDQSTDDQGTDDQGTHDQSTHDQSTHDQSTDDQSTDDQGTHDRPSRVAIDPQPSDACNAARPEPSDPPGGTHTAGTPSSEPTATVGRTRRALTRQGRRPHLSVMIGLNTLAGIDDLPAMLAGFGAIPACLGRAIAISAGTATALITDPTTGLVTEAGALTYRPSQRLRDQVAALVSTCQFPSCRQPVWRCDIDHREPFEHDHPERGGRTDSANTGPFCRRHHLVKHHTDWRIRVSPERSVVQWTSPTGHRYSSTSRAALLPDLRVTTAGTALAERLDLVSTIGAASANSTSVIDELVTALLLRHQLNKAPLEYDHLESGWDRAAADNLDMNRTGDSDIDPGLAGANDQPDDQTDEPPF